MPLVVKMNPEDIPKKADVITDSKDFMDNILNVTDDNEIDVKIDVPMVLDFYADWCGPCIGLSPVIDDLANEYKNKINFYKIDIDKASDVAMLFNVMSIPTLIFISNKKNEKPIKVPGAMSNIEIKEIIEEHLLKKKNDSN